ncbi:MAG TPA: hypothetical protein VEH07_05230 [Alphaproteobacteria bacterium]|nr:hypothetical protein [Alphaproteobacteria bacterium]
MKLQVVLAAFGAAALLTTSCADMNKPAAAKAPAARVANAGQGESWDAIKRLPDWDGVWSPTMFATRKQGGPPPAPPAPPQFTPAYAAKFAAYQKQQDDRKKKGAKYGAGFVSEVANCAPYGLPESMHLPYPIEFLFTPGRVTVAIEVDSIVRRIYTDGRKLPDDPDPMYQGSSVGHWEGDTLVVDTVGINPDTDPIMGVKGHGPDLRVNERIHLVAPDTLEITTTLADPVMLTAPYTTTSTYERHRDWTIMEYLCAQNNHDGVDAKGNPTFSLERRPGE